MSHFTVTITGEQSTFDKQMAPYAEQEVDPQYLVFKDTEEESRKEYETKTRSQFYCSSSSSHGQVVNEDFFAQIRGLKPGAIRSISFKKTDIDMMHYFKVDKYYHVGLQNPDGYPKEQIWVKVVDVKTEHPDGDIIFEGTVTLEVVDAPREIPLKETYASFEVFMKEWHGSDKPDEKTGKYGYWHNPNAKWDYWRVGGRWVGHWRIKPEFRSLYAGERPEISWEWNDRTEEKQKIIAEGRVDSALKKHIDFAAMEAEVADAAGKRYYDYVWENVLKDLPINEPWSEKFWSKESGRKEYHDQPRVVAWNEFTRTPDICKKLGVDWFGGSPNEFDCTREQYINRAKFSAYSTFAVLHDGKWAERGEMGWWATVSNEDENWEETYHRIIESLPDDTRLTVLDCHI